MRSDRSLVRAIRSHWFLSAGFALIAFGCAASPRRGPIVESTSFLGELTSPSTIHAGVLFQDGGQSFAVPGGSLWVFGDTFRGHANAATKPTITDAVSNTVAFLPDAKRDFPPPLQYFTGPDGIAAAPLSFFDSEDPVKLRMWPAGGVTVDSRIYLYYSMIEVTDEPKTWNFHGLGPGLAVAQIPPSKISPAHTQWFLEIHGRGHLRFAARWIFILL